MIALTAAGVLLAAAFTVRAARNIRRAGRWRRRAQAILEARKRARSGPG